MYNFDPYNVSIAIAANIPVLLMTAFVLQGHVFLSLKGQIYHELVQLALLKVISLVVESHLVRLALLSVYLE